MKRPIDPDRTRWPEPVVGGKYVRRLDDLLRALRPADAHGNRSQHLDDGLVCYVLAAFNPAIRSLRTVEDFSRTQQAGRFLTVDRIPRSTLSDFQRLADPTKLEPIVALLRLEAEAAHPRRAAEGRPATLARVLAVDGSFFAVAADVAWAFKRRGGAARKGGRPRRAVRLDVHLDVATWLPEVVADGDSEAEHAAASIVAGAIQVYDRGIFSFELVGAHEAAGAHFVHRLREPGPRTPRFDAEVELERAAADIAAGVRSDRLGRLAGLDHRAAPQGRYREVVLVSPEQPGGQVRLLTDLDDVPAHIIGAIYRHRWQIETCQADRTSSDRWCEATGAGYDRRRRAA